jgi:antirestriction protein
MNQKSQFDMWIDKKNKQLKEIREDFEELIDDEHRVEACEFTLDDFGKMQSLLAASRQSMRHIKEMLETCQEHREMLEEKIKTDTSALNGANDYINNKVKEAKAALNECANLFS